MPHEIPQVDLVIKFGGAALAGPRRVHLAASRIETLLRAGRIPVVVTSAPGPTTDRLLARAGRVTGSPDTPCEPDQEEGPERRERDRLLATGEAGASALLALALLTRGAAARSVSGPEAGIGVLPDGTVVVDPAPLHDLLRRGWVPVVAGFQGVDLQGELRTLGRGGSDLTAVALAEALGARECALVKDVSGIHPPDPDDPRRPAAGSRPLPSLEPECLATWAAEGAGVVQAEAAERALRGRVRLRIHHYRAHPLRPGGTVVAPGALPQEVLTWTSA